MKSENQNVEYKEIWRDEFLKWICGFANARGGTIYIGVDDNGKVIGVKKFKRCWRTSQIKSCPVSA